MSRPEILVRGGVERGLIAMIVISAVIHIAFLGALILGQNGFLRASRPLVSYTVDLVEGHAIGGTNLQAGLPAAKPAAPLPAVPAPAPAEPAVKKSEPPTKAEEAPKPQSRTAEAPPEKQAAPQKESVSIAAKKPEPRKAELRKKDVPKPQKETTKEKQKVASKPPAEAPKKEAKPAPSRREAEKKPEGARPDPAAEEARKIDAAIQAAVRRRAEALQQPGVHGGPISYGPGQGAGGMIKGVEFILYYNDMMSRIKAQWAWAGTNSDLEAVVHFQVAPNGDIYNVRIVRSSGNLSYDLSIERAVRAASPLGAPPEKYRENFSNVEITFRAQDLRS